MHRALTLLLLSLLVGCGQGPASRERLHRVLRNCERLQTMTYNERERGRWCDLNAATQTAREELQPPGFHGVFNLLCAGWGRPGCRVGSRFLIR